MDIQFAMSTGMLKQNACHPRTWNLFDCLEACWQPFHTCCGSQSGEDAFQLPEAEAQVPCLTWISCLAAPFSNRWMDRQPLNHNTKRDGLSGFVSGNYISLQINEPSVGCPDFFIDSASIQNNSSPPPHWTTGHQPLDLDLLATSGFNSGNNFIKVFLTIPVITETTRHVLKPITCFIETMKLRNFWLKQMLTQIIFWMRYKSKIYD